MAERFKALVRRLAGRRPGPRWLGRLEKVFLAFLVLALVAKLASSSLELLAGFAAFIAGVLVVFRWLIVGMKAAIWRLRYRLVVAYLFIAVVPIALIMILVGVGSWILSGQIAAYLVTTELERRANTLFDPALGLAATPLPARLERAGWVAPYFSERFPGFRMVIHDRASAWRYPEGASVPTPPAGWPSASGLLMKDGEHYLWAHAVHQGVEVTMLAPMGRDTLSQLVPQLGDVTLIPRQPSEGGGTAVVIRPGEGRQEHLPPPVNRFDLTVLYGAPVSVALWEAPGRFDREVLAVYTRYSAILRTVFGQKVEWGEGVSTAWVASLAFSVVAGLLLAVELVSVVVGVSLTRTITRAVHGLYDGTQHVREGDFSHRIEVHGNDQLAELGHSFNRMTENLERLVEVAKEKERLQSELEIAREVQNQLFPRSKPVSNTLQLTATCRPARLVSGDYYDWLNLNDSQLALAVGDVAGKGISAALLMATVQSTMRAQLRAGREKAAAAGNGGGTQPLSTASLVSRLNQQLYAYTPPEKFATFFFALYDDSNGELAYTNAGHLPPILVRRGESSRLEVTGTVVGAFAFSQYAESSLRMEPGDLLVCFTDGVTEPENEFGEMYGEDRLTELVVRLAKRDPEEIIAAVADAVRHWTGSSELQDDMTMLIARRT